MSSIMTTSIRQYNEYLIDENDVVTRQASRSDLDGICELLESIRSIDYVFIPQRGVAFRLTMQGDGSQTTWIECKYEDWVDFRFQSSEWLRMLERSRLNERLIIQQVDWPTEGF
jgi:hypothetical protein